MAENIIGSTGFIAEVTSGGKLMVDASVTASVNNIGENLAPIPSSGGLTSMNYNGSLFPLLSDNGSHLMIAGSISSMPAISATNNSVAKDGAASTGSGTLVGGDYLGSLVSMKMTAGSELITTGSQVITNTVDVLGSVNIDNAAAIGSLATQNIAGSVTSSGYIGVTPSGTFYSTITHSGTGVTVDQSATVRQIDAGSVIVTNAITGSVNIATNPVPISGVVTQGTDPWVTLGSTAITNTITANVAAGSSIVTQTVAPTINISNGSIVAATGAGSKIITGLLNEIKWVSIKGVNSGSTYQLSIKDSEGYLIQPSLTHTGDWAFLTPFAVSGTLVLNMTSAQVDGTYHFRLGYI